MTSVFALSTLCIPFAAALILFFDVPAHTQQAAIEATAQYEAVDIDGSGGGFSWAHDVNNRGQIVGRFASDAGSHHAFLWERGVMLDLGTLPGGSHSEAYAINDRGQVVGWSTVDETTRTLFDGCWHAFLWANGTMTDLGSLGDNRFQSYAYSINDRGQIVGISSTGDYPTGVWRAVVWQRGTIIELDGVPEAVNTSAFDINSRGRIVGAWEGTSGGGGALRWRRRSTDALATLPGATRTEAHAISSRGLIAGFGDSAEHPGQSHAILWAGDRVTDLGTLPGGVWSFGRNINNRRQVVGESLIPFLGYRALSGRTAPWSISERCQAASRAMRPPSTIKGGSSAPPTTAQHFTPSSGENDDLSAGRPSRRRPCPSIFAVSVRRIFRRRPSVGDRRD
jgi:probable HAF family extracellular repeat protein